MSIRKWRLRQIQNSALAHFRYSLGMVDAEPAQGMFNWACFDNAVQWATTRNSRIADGADRWGVCEVILVSGGTPVLHYVNSFQSRLFETTIGWQAEHCEYYKLRDINPKDWHRIGTEVDNAMSLWTKFFTTWFDRSVLRIDRAL